MRHDPRWVTFYNSYINQFVEFDTQNTIRGRPAQDKLIKMLSHVSLTRDPRATRDMVPREVWEDVPPDSDIEALEEERTRRKAGRFRIKGRPDEEELRRLSMKIRCRRSRRKKKVRVHYRRYHFDNRPTWDIERQARGETEPEYVPPVIELHIAERAELAEILCNQSDVLSEDELHRQRVRTANLITALCGKRETPKRARIRQRQAIEVPVKQESTPEPDPFPLLLDWTQCPDCFGDERLTLEERRFKYARPSVRNDHFDDEHLEERERAGRLLCKHPKCKEVRLESLDHFRNHVKQVHKVSLRTSQQAQQRRSRKIRWRLGNGR